MSFHFLSINANSLHGLQRRRSTCLRQSEADQPEKHNLGGGCWVLASCQVSSNYLLQLQRSRKCLSQSEAKHPSLFSNWPEKHNFYRGYWVLASCQVSSNSGQRLQRRSNKNSERKVLLKQYKTPTDPSKFSRGITATKTNKRSPKVELDLY